MPVFETKVRRVLGRRVAVREMVPTAHGLVPAEVGDYILIDPMTGDAWPIKAEILEQRYNRVAE
jgi:hypothetical protein